MKRVLLAVALAACSGSNTAPPSDTQPPPLARPVISDFHATPSDVPIGGTTTLSWTVSGAASISIDPGVGDVTGLSSKMVGVPAGVVFVLTATNAGGSVTRTVPVTAHEPGPRLAYTDPVAPAKVVVVRNALSTARRIVLDVKVGLLPIMAFGLAINLPLDPTGATMVTPSLSTNGAIDAGSSPATAVAFVGAAGSPIANVLSVGVAKNKAAAGTAGDDTWAPGATLFSIVLDLNASASGGTAIFTHLAPFTAAAIAHDGSTVLGSGDVAIGDLVVAP